jgi:hypothetical protein
VVAAWVRVGVVEGFLRSCELWSLPLARASLSVLCARGFGGLRRRRAGPLEIGVARARGFGRFFEALFSSAGADEIVRFVCSRVRRFAPYPLAR